MDKKNKRILIIEDDKFLRKIIKKKLLNEDYDVIEGIDGEEGLRLAQEKKPDLILLDLVLPSMDGFEVLSKLRKDKKTSKTPVFIFSNLNERENIKKGLKMGADDYLIKSNLNPEDIIVRIEKLFSK